MAHVCRLHGSLLRTGGHCPEVCEHWYYQQPHHHLYHCGELLHAHKIYYTVRNNAVTQDMIVHAALAVGSLAGAAALAAYLPDYREVQDQIQFIQDADDRAFVSRVAVRIITAIEATTVSQW